MKTTNRETIKLTVNILIRKFCEDKAAKNFSMSKKEAEDYGACDLSAQTGRYGHVE